MKNKITFLLILALISVTLLCCTDGTKENIGRVELKISGPGALNDSTIKVGEKLTKKGIEAFRVLGFREKPDADTAERYLGAGPENYLWNSGMFIWKAGFFLECVRRYEPAVYEGIMKIAEAWGGPDAASVIADVYPH